MTRTTTTTPGTIASSEKKQPLSKRSKALFDENDANCNSCINFKRIKHDKRIDGMLHGGCDKMQLPGYGNIYNITFWIHPSDPMNMPCWKSRTPELLV